MLRLVLGLLIFIGAECRETVSLQTARKIPEERLGMACPIELNYSPQCICDFWPYETYNIYCNASSAEELNVITQAFQHTPIVKHTEVKISLTGSISLPANVFSNKTAVSIIFECIGTSGRLGLIDPQAFILTAATTSSFQINFCDLTEFDFAFLAQLRVLETLRLYNTTVTTMARMPFMPHMRTIELYAPSGLREWHDPAQTPFLDTITINAAVDTDQETMEKILDTLVYYDSSLRRLYLVNLGLIRIPPAVRNLSSLNTLDFSSNLIRTLPTGSLALSSTLDSLWLGNMLLENIEPGAFQGNFRPTLVYMVFNKLTTFPRETYEGTLEEMLQASGSFNIYGNPIACDDCHLDWLINEKRYLLTRVRDGMCANGTSFDQLDSQVYSARCAKDNNNATSIKSPSLLLISVLIFFGLLAVQNVQRNFKC